ncbi:unnamed protein product [Owenia fusiformis]|uniref:Uncharacterized protein n=1 Tax=Owenia fusiformis TaxID=6347 RepID=A0A8S4P1V9_OWEFU|nr:unnamed protein product [Owenia fusiformis]
MYELGLCVKINEGCTSGLKCNKKTACSCEMSDGSGIIDLSSLDSGGSGPRFTIISSSDVFGHYELIERAYNPCTTFVPKESGQCPKKQMYLYSYNLVKDQGHVVTNSCSILGTPDDVKFVYNESDNHTTIQYKVGAITTDINLICNKTIDYNGDFSIKRVNETTYIGSIISPCACRNGCQQNIIYYVIFGIAILIVVILSFCAVGMVYKRCKGARGWEMIPFCGCKKKGYTEIN